MSDVTANPPTTTASATAKVTASASAPRRGRPIDRIGSTARWALAVAAVLWLSWCTAVSPLYWEDSSIAAFGWLNALYGLLAFVIYMALIVALVRVGRREPPLGWHTDRATGERTPRRILPERLRRRRSGIPIPADADASSEQGSGAPDSRRTRWCARARIAATHAHAFLSRWIVRLTDRRWKLWTVFLVGWLWAPTTLLAAFGADLRSQAREFSWAWNQWTGLKQPYIGFFSFAPMDIYPTAHYLWPADPTYLTDQHNIVLTIFYGATMAASRYLTGSNDWGVIALAAAQFLFAVCCTAATAHRFLNLPWMRRTDVRTARRDFAHPERGSRFRPRTFARPERGVRPALPPEAAHAGMRLAVVVFFLVCPLAVFSTISLTKSPLFAFAFLWAFGFWYELHALTDASRTDASASRKPLILRLPRRTLVAFTVANAVMLISAKYAWYVLLFEFVLAIAADRRRWATYVVAILLPTILIHGGISMAISSGAIIGGDPIESHGVQLQMIARVAERAPETIPESARKELAPVFNLDQMADAYFPQDADPVKSSGIQSKKVSYRWRSVKPDDMKNFNKAWLEIVKANPVVAMDALMAKCYGYFDIADLPYVSMNYYVDSDYVQKNSTWLRYVNHDWRERVATFADSWGAIPVLGWVTHGNFYVILTLLIGAAEVILKRWRSLAWHLPLLLLMGVMITAPANNFERHMLPVAFCFAFLCLTFHRDSRSTDGGETVEVHNHRSYNHRYEHPTAVRHRDSRQQSLHLGGIGDDSRQRDRNPGIVDVMRTYRNGVSVPRP
ncbi:hypothetical protein Uis4E_0239 [Bifidobacterium parmae]|uniref:Beta-carotene 15,15'-monooxygenase n=2 Tax=Bifidobacterium parmae TaxID=361854 RepID=A0A2N5J5W7_9BIFI|nr:DUF6020 family protein [Bifidobacterium parmae]PLS29602.1 hypothetical protein Uis4E_0239 [Bifidobacterium parmae]